MFEYAIDELKAKLEMCKYHYENTINEYTRLEQKKVIDELQKAISILQKEGEK